MRVGSKKLARPEVVADELSFEVIFMPGLPMGLRWVKDHMELWGFGSEVSFNPTPSAATWRRFWLNTDQLGVWGWNPRYDNFDILDGVAWELTIRYQGRAVRSGGLNAFPGTVKDIGE